MTPLPPVLPIKSAPPPRPVYHLVPKLRWPSFDISCSMADLDRFPSYHEEINRYAAGEFGAWSDGFKSAVRNASSRIWLVDGFLLKIDGFAKGSFIGVFDRVLRQTSAQDIRLLTSNKDGHKEQVKHLLALQDARRAPPRNEPFTIEVRMLRGGRTGTRLPHDRFAVIDEELWHWGANVGGTHHEINAFSHGWSANDTLAFEYFERLWNAAEVSA